MNTVVAVVLAKERRMVARFVTAGAVSRDRAQSLEQLGLNRGVILRRLRERAVVRQAAPDLYYVDEESWNAVRRMRRRAASVLLIIGLIIIFAVLWSKRAHALGPSSFRLQSEVRDDSRDFRDDSRDFRDDSRGFRLQAEDRSSRQVDAVFAEWNQPTSPGCALGVFRDGKIVYERGYGMADLENDVPITPSSVFYVGSLSKQFTAAAAALAIGKGSLSADDPIRKYLPELPPYADAITVRQLVHHTSGLRDYNTLLSIAGRRGDEAYDNPTVLRMTARQKALNFAPGTEYLYSNTGYTLLAVVVERATRTPFAAFADESIFKPLGMTETHFHTDAGRLVKRRANAYILRPDGSLRLDTPSNERAGAGGVFTSVRELLHWDENFYTAKVGGRQLIDQLQTPGRLGNGTPLTYGWGLQVGTYRGLRSVEHGGALGGYRAHLMRFPDQHTSFAALCNLAIAPGDLVRQVADVVLAGRLSQPRPASAAPARGQRTPADAPLAMDAQALSVYTGSYVSDEIDSTFNIAVTDGKLTLQRDTDAQPVTLQPGQPDSFRAAGFTIRFERKDGRVTSLRVDAGRVRDIAFVKGSH